MKIVVNVRVTAEQLQRIRTAAGDADVVAATEGPELTRHIRDATVLCGRLSPELFTQAGQLRWVQALAAGVDDLLFPAFVASDVILTSEKGHVGSYLAEQAFALLLALTRGVARAGHERTWANAASIRAQCRELADCTLGIVGFGGTGRAVARRGAAFGMRVLAVDPEPVERLPEVEALWSMEGFERLLRESDVIVICAPLTPATRGLFGWAAFERMKRSAIVINVTRGAIVDDAALVHALRTKLLAGAGLDVTPVEPLPADHPLWAMENVVITPHVAGAAPRRQDRAIDLFCRNVIAFRQGQALESVIDKVKGY